MIITATTDYWLNTVVFFRKFTDRILAGDISWPSLSTFQRQQWQYVKNIMEHLQRCSTSPLPLISRRLYVTWRPTVEIASLNKPGCVENNFVRSPPLNTWGGKQDTTCAPQGSRMFIHRDRYRLLEYEFDVITAVLQWPLTPQRKTFLKTLTIVDEIPYLLM